MVLAPAPKKAKPVAGKKPDQLAEEAQPLTTQAEQ